MSITKHSQKYGHLFTITSQLIDRAYQPNVPAPPLNETMISLVTSPGLKYDVISLAERIYLSINQRYIRARNWEALP